MPYPPHHSSTPFCLRGVAHTNTGSSSFSGQEALGKVTRASPPVSRHASPFSSHTHIRRAWQPTCWDRATLQGNLSPGFLTWVLEVTGDLLCVLCRAALRPTCANHFPGLAVCVLGSVPDSGHSRTRPTQAPCTERSWMLWAGGGGRGGGRSSIGSVLCWP